MSKHHHQSKAEQIDNKARGAEPLHYEKTPKESKSIMSGHSQMTGNGDGSGVHTLAYQIYEEKGGSAFDNWLEAERILGINGPIER